MDDGLLMMDPPIVSTKRNLVCHRIDTYIVTILVSLGKEEK